MRWGDHWLVAYDDPAQSLEAVAAYFTAGIAEGAQCTYVVVDDHAGEKLAGVLARAGVPVEPALAGGALRFLTASEYRPPGPFHPGLMVNRIRELLDNAAAGHFAGLRLAVEMEWTLVTGVSSDELIEWEAVATSLLLSGCRASAICLYDQAQFSTDVLAWLACTHPIVLLGGTEPRDPFDHEGGWAPALVRLARDLPRPPGEGGKAWQSLAFTALARAETQTACRLDLLSEVGRVLCDCSLDYVTTLDRVARLCVPVLGDCAIIDLAREDGPAECAAAAHLDPRRHDLIDRLRRNDILGVVAHDLRSPLNVVAGTSSMLAIHDLPAQERHDKLQVIRYATDRRSAGSTGRASMPPGAAGTLPEIGRRQQAAMAARHPTVRLPSECGAELMKQEVGGRGLPW